MRTYRRSERVRHQHFGAAERVRFAGRSSDTKRLPSWHFAARRSPPKHHWALKRSCTESRRPILHGFREKWCHGHPGLSVRSRLTRVGNRLSDRRPCGAPGRGQMLRQRVDRNRPEIRNIWLLLRSRVQLVSPRRRPRGTESAVKNRQAPLRWARQVALPVEADRQKATAGEILDCCAPRRNSADVPRVQRTPGSPVYFFSRQRWLWSAGATTDLFRLR